MGTTDEGDFVFDSDDDDLEYCSNCGKIIHADDYDTYEGLCMQCYFTPDLGDE